MPAIGHALGSRTRRVASRRGARRGWGASGTALLLLAASVSGCEAPPSAPLPIEYETERLRIGTELQLCAGDLLEFERALLFIEEDLGLRAPPTVTVYLWEHESWEARGSAECLSRGTYVFGCYYYTHSTVHATHFSLYHELTHAVVGNPDLDVFFNEGIADAYARRVLPFGLTAPTLNVDTSTRNFDNMAAAHFARWLRERWGGHRLGQLAASRGFEDFESIFGMSLAEAEALYFAEAPSIYPPVQSCDDPELPRWELLGGWAEEFEFDCDDDDTLSGLVGMIGRRTFEVPEDGRYSLVTDGLFFRASRCAEGPIDVYRSDPALSMDDIPPEYAGYPSPRGRMFEGGEVHTVELRRGRYNLMVGADGFEASRVSFAAWPSLTPGPVGAGQ
jgi:hypothetical protein